MPRRRYLWWNQPVILEEFKPAPKPPPLPSHIDASGRVWQVVYLVGSGKGGVGRTTLNAHDATHRGFRSEWYRRTYRFRTGDDRSLNAQTIANQFASSRATKTRSAALHDQCDPRRHASSYAERVQQMYAERRKGMLPGLE